MHSYILVYETKKRMNERHKDLYSYYYEMIMYTFKETFCANFFNRTSGTIIYPTYNIMKIRKGDIFSTQ